MEENTAKSTGDESNEQPNVSSPKNDASAAAAVSNSNGTGADTDDLFVRPPENGETYDDDDEAFNNIKCHLKRSHARGQAINTMIQKGYIKGSRSSIYKKIREKYELIGGINISSKSLNDSKQYGAETAKLLGLGYEGYYIAPAIRMDIKWKGQLVLPLIATTFDAPCPRPKGRDILKRRMEKEIDICVLLRNTDTVVRLDQRPNESFDEWYRRGINYYQDLAYQQVCQENNVLPLDHRYIRLDHKCMRVSKLYFDSVKSPPPTDNGTKSENRRRFDLLKNRIEEHAEAQGNPVVCIGGSELKREKRFKCARWHRRNIQGQKGRNVEDRQKTYGLYSCTFNFTVKWDSYGFYITILSNKNRSHNNGCAWHCCTKP